MHLIAAVLAVSLLSASFARSQTVRPPAFTPGEISVANQNPRLFTLDAASVEIARLMPAADAAEPVFPAPTGGDIGIFPIVAVDRIANRASRSVSVVRDNSQVVKIVASFANAIPEGITRENLLTGWSRPESRHYAFYARNQNGDRVVAVTYRVIWKHSGRYEGRGRYLDRVTVEPLSITVAPGYRFSMTMTAPSVTTSGTSADPVASMRMALDWSVVSALASQGGSSTYFMSGTGTFQQLSGPFRSEQRAAAREMLERAGPVMAPAARAW